MSTFGLEGKNVVIYLRVSTANQVGNTSMGDDDFEGFQEEECIKYATTCNAIVKKIYRDKGVSGKSLTGRQALLELRTYVIDKRNTISAILFYDVSRFARNRRDFEDLLLEFSKANIRVIDVTSPSLDSLNHNGRFFLKLKADVVEWQGEDIIIRGINGMRKLLEMGYNPFPPKWGYTRKFKKAKQKGLPDIDRKDPGARLYVEEAFRLKLLGTLSNVVIAEKLKAMGMNGNPKTIQNRLGNLYKDIFYAGIICKKGKSINIDNVVGKHEPYISVDEFYIINNMPNNSNKKTGGKPNEEFLLASNLVCNDCGKVMTTNITTKYNGRKHYYYRCVNRHCTTRRNLARNKVEEAFYVHLDQIKLGEDKLTVLRRILAERYSAEYKEQTDLVAQYNNEIISLENQISKVNESYFRGSITEEEQRKYLDKYRGELALKKKIVNEAKNNVDNMGKLIQDSINLLQHLPSYLEMLDTRDKVVLFDILFPEKLYYQDGDIYNPKLCPLFQYIQEVDTKLSHNGEAYWEGLQPGDNVGNVILMLNRLGFLSNITTHTLSLQ